MGERNYQSTVFYRVHHGAGVGEQAFPFGLNMMADVVSPVSHISQDVKQVFHRPRSRSEWVNRTLTPVEGFINIGVGIFDVVMMVRQMLLSAVTLPLILLALPLSLLSPRSVESLVTFFNDTFGLDPSSHPSVILLQALGVALAAPFMQLALGLMGLVRGVTQLLVTPFVGLQLSVCGLLEGFHGLKMHCFRMIAPNLMEAFALEFLNAEEKRMYSAARSEGAEHTAASAAFSTCAERYRTLSNSMEKKDFKTLMKEKKAQTLVFILKDLGEAAKAEGRASTKHEQYKGDPKSCGELWTLFQDLKCLASAKAPSDFSSDEAVLASAQKMFEAIDSYYGFNKPTT